MKKLLFACMVLASVFVVVGCGQASKNRKAREAICKNNLRQIGTAWMCYCFNECFQEKAGVTGLEALRIEQLDEPKSFVCPSTLQEPAAPGEPLTARTCSYLYFGGLKDTSNPSLPIVMDLPGNHDEIIQYVRVDGSAGNIKYEKGMSATDAVYRILGKKSGFTEDEQKIVDQAKAWDNGDKDGTEWTKAVAAAKGAAKYMPRNEKAEAEAVSSVFSSFCYQAQINQKNAYRQYAAGGESLYNLDKSMGKKVPKRVNIRNISFSGTEAKPEAIVEYSCDQGGSEHFGRARFSFVNGTWKIQYF